jgi:hypothetical protein
MYPQRRHTVGSAPIAALVRGSLGVGGVFYSRGVHTEGAYLPARTAAGALDAVVKSRARARKRPKDALTHVRSWPLRPTPAQQRVIAVRFDTGRRVYNAVLAEMLGRSKAANADPGWAAATEMPKTTKQQRAQRNKAFNAVCAVHGFTAFAANTFASSLRRTWVREHLPAQETQNMGKQAFGAVADWHWGRKGRPRFKPARRGLHSLSCSDNNGALRPKTDVSGRLLGLQWGNGFVIGVGCVAAGGRRRKEQQAALAEIEALIAAGKVLYARIVRTIIAGQPTYRMQLVVDGKPPQRHPIGDGRVSFDLGPSQIAVAVERCDGTWTGWIEPLADRIALDTVRLHRAQRHLDRQHRTNSPECFNTDGAHRKTRCGWLRSAAARRTGHRVAEQHRSLAEHRKTLHGQLANRLLGHGGDVACEKINYVAWQKNFPRSVRDRAPGQLVEIMGRKAESAGGATLYEYCTYTTALSQTCLCGKKVKKPLSQRGHRCECGIKVDQDLFSAYLGLHVQADDDGSDRLDLQAANEGWLHRQDVGVRRNPAAHKSKWRGRRRPPSRRSVARIKARRALKRQSRSARTFPAGAPTALPAQQAA